MAPFADTWRSIHTRETYEVPGVRFYTNAGNRSYTPTKTVAAEAITQQAVEPIDFPATVLQAWEDGVRIFVEHGPRAILTGAIPKILGDRPHLAVALDSQERRGLRALAESVSKLWVHGVAVAVDAFDARMQLLRDLATPAAAAEHTRTVTLPAHWPAVIAEPVIAEPVIAEPVVAASAVSTTTASGNGSTPMPDSQHQLMPPAPHFPAPLVLPRTAVSNGARTEVVISHRAAEPAAVTGRMATAMNLVASVSEAHSRFVERQAQAHASFLTMRGELVRMAAGRPSTLPAPAAPAALPPAPPPASPPPPAPPPASQPPAPPPPPARPVDVPVAPVTQTPATTTQPPLWSRAQLEVLAGGSIAEVFGPQFAELDQYERLVRMPQPPLLFADRVMSIEGEPGSMGTGRIVTETDVTADQWYMHVGRMSPGVVIESGQADLLLASWLGADFSNRGERVYRLLGCDLTFMGE
jgi:acyl transferase domain-containing protein